MADSLPPDRRAALQRFEEAYARWSTLCQALTAAELRLWAEALRDRGSAQLPTLAEEVVLYPALAQAGEKMHAGHAYTEQTTAKMQMAELENIQPTTPEWMDKLKHIEGAVLTHMFEEESSWFLRLKEKGEHQAHLTDRFREEFERYCGVGPGGTERGDAGLEAAAPMSPLD